MVTAAIDLSAKLRHVSFGHEAALDTSGPSVGFGSAFAVQRGFTPAHHDAAVHEAGNGQLWTYDAPENCQLNVRFPNVSAAPPRHSADRSLLRS
jgi:hypothetical protein